MFACNAKNALLARLLAGLMIAVTVVVGSLLHATAHAQYTL